ncbi:MAG: EI24 domain-containing protein [Deltaproteobacteria bacterium]|nr:EI24 domain-containing protein [Deltaproteobacteria bacterium]
MSAESGPRPSPSQSLTRNGPLALIGAGRRAFREIPGLRRYIVFGFVINLLVFVTIAALSISVVYPLVVSPLADKLATLQTEGGFLMGLVHTLLSWLLWVLQALLLAVTALFSFLISLTLLTLWYETLAAKIVSHFRGASALRPPLFSLGLWIRGLGRTLRESLLLIMLSVGALLLGLIPVVGPVLSLLINGYLIGWEVREPYLMVRIGMGEERSRLRAGLMLWTLRAGLLPVLLALIPVLGWIILPLVMILMTAGVAYTAEHLPSDSKR